MNAIEMIKLERQRAAAEAAAKEAAEKQHHLISKDRFARIHEFVTQTADLPSKDYHWHASGTIPYARHLAQFNETSVQFWDGSGNTGLSIYADGTTLRCYGLAQYDGRCISEQEAIDLLTKRAAQYLILEESK